MAIEKRFRLARQIIRILLFCSIGVMLVSCSLSIIVGNISAFWFNLSAVYFSIFSLTFSIVGLTTISFYRIYLHDKVWPNIRKEVLLLFLSVLSLSLLGLITNLSGV